MRSEKCNLVVMLWLDSHNVFERVLGV